MPPRMPPLDEKTLAKLRRLVRSIHARDARQLRLADLIDVAEQVPDNTAVTIDIEASRDLGEPMVVLRVPHEPEPAACLSVLSPREREVVVLIADGLSNKQIARRMGLSLPTVKDHVHRILEKTGLDNRAAVAAAQNGHVPPPHDGTGRPIGERK